MQHGRLGVEVFGDGANAENQDDIVERVQRAAKEAGSKGVSVCPNNTTRVEPRNQSFIILSSVINGLLNRSL